MIALQTYRGREIEIYINEFNDACNSSRNPNCETVIYQFQCQGVIEKTLRLFLISTNMKSFWLLPLGIYAFERCFGFPSWQIAAPSSGIVSTGSFSTFTLINKATDDILCDLFLVLLNVSRQALISIFVCSFAPWSFRYLKTFSIDHLET